MANLFVFSLNNRPIIVDTTGKLLYDRALDSFNRLFSVSENVKASDVLNFPSYSTVMAALRKDTVYNFKVQFRSIDFNFSIGTVPRPSSLTDEITDAVNKAIESIQRAM